MPLSNRHELIVLLIALLIILGSLIYIGMTAEVRP